MPITPPGSTIGIVGGGQLGRMLARAASRMGYKTHIYTPEKDSPASHVATKTTIGAYRDATALRDFAQSVDVVTFEFENIPAETLEMLDAIVAVRPKPSVLFTTRHRLREKEFIRAQGIATAPFAPVRTPEELAAAIQAIGTPAVLKTAEMGYDGKGQVVIRGGATHSGVPLPLRERLGEGANQSPRPADGPLTQPSPAGGEGLAAWASLGKTECVLEGFVDFSAEASIIVARSTHGEMRCYPLVQNIHRDRVLHKTIAPAPFIDTHQAEAVRIAKTLAEALDVVGLLAVELFVTRDGLLVNELAPRPHNSGHWSMEGAPTAQFEQHIRAICGWALGDTTAHRPCEMINLLGDEWQQWEEYAKNPEAHVHLYGKTESRPGRKMGHVTIVKR
ncbi:MAG: 5-(carboxyamino)imidazole ribonucleotide synthase [Alphaproteobacteria bacterium]|nr:5-(carboxyamino)imidazole ribonucleotide synthase [Alphaproteobacteria bacterium]